MRALLATLLLALATTPVAARDRYSGYYNADCGDLVCDLRIRPIGAGAWSVVWEAIDPRDPSLTPVCRLEGRASTAGIAVEDIAEGKMGGYDLALWGLKSGILRVKSGAGCGPYGVAGVYEAVGD